MNKWSAEKIKSLRLRLGWSAADFARRFGCTSDVIMEWEKGTLPPSPEDLMQFDRLEFYLESYSEQVSRGPIADFALNTLRLNQIYHVEVNQFTGSIRREY